MSTLSYKKSASATLPLLVLIILSSACSAPTPRPLGADRSTFNGVWVGKGHQDNDTTWTIRLTITPDEAKIEYPSLRCTGRLQFLEHTGTELLFREHLEVGLGRCVNKGTTILRLTGRDQMLFHWYYPDGHRGATGNLVRRHKETGGIRD